MIDQAASLDRTMGAMTERLLALRTPAGHWEGHLASSALATATAVIALRLAERTGLARPGLVEPGLAWLATHQNADGGWGDTPLNASNLSTSVLCWGALALADGPDAATQSSVRRAEQWLHEHLGDLAPDALKRAVLARYGRDYTFSVPILTVLALTGRLGPADRAWRQVPQLPFELAACPHRWFRWLQLPVVSYALPALVAIGQVRHHHAPTRNPLLGPLRSGLRRRTLGVARSMQPSTGGYLEATPLTAFVVMSLISAGTADHPIVEHGLRFLAASARSDGSWPIDTNLATWITTLSVDALADADVLSPADRATVLEWLLSQQSRDEHPFTRTPPGGWAWTNEAGGVPDADDTAGALTALRQLAGPASQPAAAAGVQWLLGLQNRDGGIPTFCRGWGALPFDRSAPDLTAHALEAWHAWYPTAPPSLQRRLSGATRRALAYLAREQRPDGSWVPLWFGNERAPGETNPSYGTSSVVAALALTSPTGLAEADGRYRRGLRWLLDAQNPDGGWGGGDGTPSSMEETGQALRAVALGSLIDSDGVSKAALARGVQWLIESTREGRTLPPAPIGLYFARLWYYDELYPLVFGLRGLSHARRALIGPAT